MAPRLVKAARAFSQYALPVVAIVARDRARAAGKMSEVRLPMSAPINRLLRIFDATERAVRMRENFGLAGARFLPPIVVTEQAGVFFTHKAVTAPRDVDVQLVFFQLDRGA